MIKRLVILLLQGLVTAGGIYYVFHDPAKRAQIGGALRQSHWHWLLLSWFCYGLLEAIATVRWQILLRVQRITLGWLRAGAIVIIGLFFNLFLPGLVGGDLIRLYFVFIAVPGKKTGATLSVVMDRALGLLAVLTLALLAVTLRFGWLSRFPQTAHITYLALGLVGGTSLFVIALFVSIGFGLLERLPRRLPFRRPIVRVGRALRAYLARPSQCLIAFGLTIITHLAYYITYYCAARSLESAAAPHLIDLVSIMPLVNTITGVPISFGGIGVRETLFQELLGRLAGVPGELAAFSASLGFAIQVSWGLVGGLVYYFVPLGRRKTRGR